jgi:hypothetical protein
MGQSKNVHANNGDRSVFPTRCEIRRSKDESAYGRERPRLWLPRACVRAGRSRPSGAERGTGQRSKSISTGSRMDQKRIATCASKNQQRSALQLSSSSSASCSEPLYLKRGTGTSLRKNRIDRGSEGDRHSERLRNNARYSGWPLLGLVSISGRSAS